MVLLLNLGQKSFKKQKLKVALYPLSAYFEGEFFETKLVVYVNAIMNDYG